MTTTAGPGQPPRIGLSTYRQAAAWGVWNDTADMLPSRYALSVTEAGGAALLLPPAPVSTADAVLDGLHGVLLAGGGDVDPARYGAPREANTQEPQPDRDEWEIALALGAIERDLPVLAVCRGMQLLDVALGGTLVQDLPAELGSTLHCPTVGVHERHSVRVKPGSRLAGVIGAGLDVATYHHQAVRTLGAGLTGTAWASDGIVEAVEMAGRSWIFGVQWHPEAFAGAPLFAAFVAACRAHRDALARAS